MVIALAILIVAGLVYLERGDDGPTGGLWL